MITMNHFLLFALLLAAPTSGFAPNTKKRPLISTIRHASSTGSSFPPFPKKNDPKQSKEKNSLLFDANPRQLLGLKDAAQDKQQKWKTRLQLMKPISWAPLSLIVMCGAAASGNYHWIWNPLDASADVVLGFQDAVKGLAAVILAGPFSEGFAQTINDWYDRDIDAINEPYRPIPSGAITKEEVFQQLNFLFVGGLALAFGLDLSAAHTDFPIITAIALFGSCVSYIYSAPPLKLKQNGLLGDLAIGLCYISLPWWCGQAAFAGQLDRPVDWILPVAYSFTALGAGIVNDFKSMEGDKAFGLQSIPILVGVDTAKYLAAASPDLVQLSIALYMYSIGEDNTAAVLVGLVLPQLYFQMSLLFPDPIKNDLKYVAFSQPFLILSVLASALCVGHHDWTSVASSL